MARFDAVVFDLDDTLCTQTQSGSEIYYGAFREAGIDSFGTPADLWGALVGSPDPVDDVGYLAAGFTTVAAQYGQTPIDAEALADGFLSVVDHSAVTFLPDAKHVLKTVNESFSIGLLTNGPCRRQAQKIAALNIESTFEAIVYAGDLPRQKPNREPFDRVLDTLGSTPSRTMYVGNSLRHDVAGAQGVGMTAVWYTPTGADPAPYEPEYIIESLAELLSVVSR